MQSFPIFCPNNQMMMRLMILKKLSSTLASSTSSYLFSRLLTAPIIHLIRPVPF